MSEFKMPDIGEGVMEGEVVKWLVKEGDTVKEDQPMLEVMTDKATVVIPCPTNGVVKAILVKEGQSAKVGSPLISFGEGGTQSAAPAAAEKAADNGRAAATAPAARREESAPAPAARAQAPAAPTQPAATAPSAAPSPAGPRRDQPAAPRSTEQPARPAADARPPREPVQENGRRPAGAAHYSAPGGSGRILAAPATRRMAREAGVDLHEVDGSGPHGRITREDLEAYVEGRAHQPAAQAHVAAPETWPGEVEAPSPTSTSTHAGSVAAGAAASSAPPAAAARPVFPAGPRPETRVPMKGMRKRISENMRRSKDHAAHFTYVEECDMTELMSFRESVEELARQKQVRLSYLPFIMKAIVSGLREYPMLNSSYDEEKQEIVLKGYYNLGIAAASDEGLTVPVVKDVDRKNILELAADIQHLGEAARSGRLKLDELQGSTFTITSLGAIGGILATPVINWPEVAILGVHKIRPRPVVRNNEIVIRQICYLSISLDHRVIDGHVGAQFMQHVVKLLEDPRLLLLGAI